MSLQNNFNSQERISFQLENLLPQSNLEQIKVFMGDVWFGFAKMKEKLDEIETHSNIK